MTSKKKTYSYHGLAERISSLHKEVRQMAHHRHQTGLQDHGLLNISTSLGELSRYLGGMVGDMEAHLNHGNREEMKRGER